MNHFSNINVDNENLSFELHNNNIIKLSLANAIRRIIICEIPTFAIDSVNFEENSSMLQNDYLAKRLTLIPFNSNVNDSNFEQLILSLDKTNNTDHMISITSDDFIIKSDNTIVDNVLVNNEILFAKLKPTQSIKLTCNFAKSNVKFRGAAFTPVCKSILTYKVDEKKINELTKKLNQHDKKYFLDTQTEPHYLITDTGEPAIFILSLESLNTMKPKDIVESALTVLKEKLQILLHSVNENIDSKISITQSNRLFTAYDFVIIDEDHTLGNLISSYLNDNPNIDYDGYVIPHPNDNKLLITTSLKNDNTLESNKKVFVETLQKILELVDKLIDNWLVANSGKIITKKIKIK